MSDEMKAVLEEIKQRAVRREEKRRGFWWHWQNLKKDEPRRKGVHGRAWLHRRRGGVFGIEWHIPGRSFKVGFTIGGIEDQVRLSLCLWLFSLYFSIEQLPLLNRWEAAKGYHDLETSLSIFAWTLWWSIWHDDNEWRKSDPKWRRGSFDIPDFFLGRNTYQKVDQEPIPAVVHLPEGDYPVTVQFFTQTWKRPRWPFARVRSGADVDSEQGLPIPGKGENSWDCDDDAFMSIGTSASTVEEAIADATKRVLERRERYGGKNWIPVKKAGK